MHLLVSTVKPCFSDSAARLAFTLLSLCVSEIFSVFQLRKQLHWFIYYTCDCPVVPAVPSCSLLFCPKWYLSICFLVLSPFPDLQPGTDNTLVIDDLLTSFSQTGSTPLCLNLMLQLFQWGRISPFLRRLWVNNSSHIWDINTLWVCRYN